MKRAASRRRGRRLRSKNLCLVQELKELKKAVDGQVRQIEQMRTSRAWLETALARAGQIEIRAGLNHDLFEEPLPHFCVVVKASLEMMNQVSGSDGSKACFAAHIAQTVMRHMEKEFPKELHNG